MAPRTYVVPPRRDDEAATPIGYRRIVRDCFVCGRDFRLYLPLVSRPSQLVDDFACPHCGRYRAEEVIPPFTDRPILVEACSRTWGEWQLRAWSRRLRIARAYGSVWIGRLARLASRPPAPRPGA